MDRTARDRSPLQCLLQEAGEHRRGRRPAGVQVAQEEGEPEEPEETEEQLIMPVDANIENMDADALREEVNRARRERDSKIYKIQRSTAEF